MQHSTSYLA